MQLRYSQSAGDQWKIASDASEWTGSLKDATLVPPEVKLAAGSMLREEVAAVFQKEGSTYVQKWLVSLEGMTRIEKLHGAAASTSTVLLLLLARSCCLVCVVSCLPCIEWPVEQRTGGNWTKKALLADDLFKLESILESDATAYLNDDEAQVCVSVSCQCLSSQLVVADGVATFQLGEDPLWTQILISMYAEEFSEVLVSMQAEAEALVKVATEIYAVYALITRWLQVLADTLGQPAGAVGLGGALFQVRLLSVHPPLAKGAEMDKLTEYTAQLKERANAMFLRGVPAVGAARNDPIGCCR